MRALCGRMPEGIPPADRKIGKAVTGLQGRTVTAHEVINIITGSTGSGKSNTKVVLRTPEANDREAIGKCDTNWWCRLRQRL